MGQFAISAALGGQIDNYRSGRHFLDHLAGDQGWRLFPWNHRGGNDYIAFRDYLAEQFALLSIEVLILGSPVTSGVLGVLGFDWQLDEASAQTHYLFFGYRSHVVGRSYRTQPARSCDGLQAGNASANYEHAGRSDCAGGG